MTFEAGPTRIDRKLPHQLVLNIGEAALSGPHGRCLTLPMHKRPGADCGSAVMVHVEQPKKKKQGFSGLMTRTARRIRRFPKSRGSSTVGSGGL